MDARELPARPDLEQYKKQAKELVKAYLGDVKAVRKLCELFGVKETPSSEEFREKLRQRFTHLTGAELEENKFSLADAQFLLAREYAFESWPKFAKHIRAVTAENSPVSKFELAADAIVTGDGRSLKRLIKENPELVRERSTRRHRSTLLHYVSANGVEDFRQKTPKNIVKITKILLDAGADVNAESDAYGGGSTTLGLAATSMHPQLAGVQNDLLEILLGAGARIDPPEAGGNQDSTVRSSLANGCGEAALYLAERGAKLDLESAAGIGRLDVVKSFFDEDGCVTAGATQRQMEEGFRYACGYGHKEVVEFLLERGVNIHTGENIDQTGLHWAVFSAQIDMIKLLLKHGANLRALNNYGGDALGQAVWCLMNNEDNAEDFIPVIETLLECGAEIEPGTRAWLEKMPFRSPQIKAGLEEILKRFGAKS